MSERAIKTIWHLALVACALLEAKTARTPGRRCLLGACAGWHAAAAVNDWFYADETVTGRQPEIKGEASPDLIRYTGPRGKLVRVNMDKVNKDIT